MHDKLVIAVFVAEAGARGAGECNAGGGNAPRRERPDRHLESNATALVRQPPRPPGTQVQWGWQMMGRI